MIIRTYAYGYTHIRVYLYAYTRIVIRTYAYIYTRIYAYTCASDVSLLFRTKTFLCVSLLWKRKSLKKRRADNRKLTYSTKLMWSYYKHARRIASCIYWITRRSSSSALSFAVDESDRKEKYYFNSASKRVNHLDGSSKRNLQMPITSQILRQTTVSLTLAWS